MGKFRIIVTEALEEAGRKKTTAQQPTPQYLIKAEGCKMQKYANGAYYFYKFSDIESNGKARPLFIPAENKNSCQKFNTEDEAYNTLNKILADFPIYDKLFEELKVVNMADNPVNNPTSNTMNKNQLKEPEVDIKVTPKANNSFFGKTKDFVKNTTNKFQNFYSKNFA